MSAPILRPSAGELRSRREKLREQVGMDRVGLETFAETHALTPEEREALDELRAIDFLLDDHS